MAKNNTRTQFALIVTFVVLTAVTTTVIRVPIPATTGYFNLGDVFIIGSGLLFGPLGGAAAGAIGAGGADLLGYPQFFLATAVTKGLEGFLVGMIASGAHPSISRIWIAAATGAVTIVVGYFVFEAYIYPALGSTMPFFNVTNLEDAIVELLPNTVQGVIGAVGGVGLWRALYAIRAGK